MRVLHTADWHLGKKLDQQDRAEEHALFLQWLLDCIQREGVEALIIAGDIFDTGSPANETLRMYYNFLVQLRQTGCRQAVIIGGNHDSISTLNAPRELLKALYVQVVGGVPERDEDQIIPLTNIDGKVQAVVAAVPFLRDRDVRLSISGESNAERELRLRDGIVNHYHKLLPLLEPYKAEGIPVLATGHLFAQGATASESEKEIHVGTLGQIPASLFPKEYDYIALGHLHRPQVVGGLNHIRYSGSPIPLSFSESTDTKQVLLLDVQPSMPVGIQAVDIPVFRHLLRVHGTPDEVKQKLTHLAIPDNAPLPCWVEVQAHTNSLISHLMEELQTLLESKPCFGLLCLRQIRIREVTGIQQEVSEYLTLIDMSPEHVFDLRLASMGQLDNIEELKHTYNEALQRMQEMEGSV